MYRYFIGIVFVISLVGCGSKKPTGRVFFVSPQNGEEVKSPVSFKMGVEGMEIQPAGEGPAPAASDGQGPGRPELWTRSGSGLRGLVLCGSGL